MRCVKPFQTKEGYLVGCGVCMPCRINRTQEWAIRIEHEAEGKDGCFLTLTYREDPGTLMKEDLVKFIKRLRERIKPVKIKYYCCGEYGDINGRAHYHCIIIGWRPSDIKRVNGQQYSSEFIASLWIEGYNVVGAIEGPSVRYVTGYIRKKLIGKESLKYEGKEPQFAIMSLGIGKDYCMKNRKMFLDKDYITKNGVKMAIPRYYKKLTEEKYGGLKALRKIRAEDYRSGIMKEYINDCKDLNNYIDKVEKYRSLERSDRQRRRNEAEAKEKKIKKGDL